MKFETLMQDSQLYKTPKNSKSVKGVAPTKKWKFLTFFGAAFPLPVAIEVKFCTAKRTNVPVSPAKPCSESPLRGEKPDFLACE